MTCDIDKIFSMLDERNDECIQQKGIECGKKVKNLSVFFQPIESKSLWTNCAKIIASKSDSELELYYCSMFDWLQDMNWPGADIIFERLLSVSGGKLAIPYRICLKMSQSNKDIPWEEALKEFWSTLQCRN